MFVLISEVESLTPDEIHTLCMESVRQRTFHMDVVGEKANAAIALLDEEGQQAMARLLVELPPRNLYPQSAKLRFCAIVIARLGKCKTYLSYVLGSLLIFCQKFMMVMDRSICDLCRKRQNHRSQHQLAVVNMLLIDPCAIFEQRCASPSPDCIRTLLKGEITWTLAEYSKM